MLIPGLWNRPERLIAWNSPLTIKVKTKHQAEDEVFFCEPESYGRITPKSFFCLPFFLLELLFVAARVRRIATAYTEVIRF